MAIVLATPEIVSGFKVPEMLFDIGQDLGFDLYIEQDYKLVGYLLFPSQQRLYFKGTSFDFNGHAASLLCTDKDYCAKILRHFGLPTPDHVLLFSPQYRAVISSHNPKVGAKLCFAEHALAFAEKHGYPLYLKPNEGVEGRGVSKVYTTEQLFQTFYDLSLVEDKILLQQPAIGRDYRVVVLNGEVVAAYERVPFSIVGDGVSTVAHLMAQQFQSIIENRGRKKISAHDTRIAHELKRQNIDLETVARKDETIELLPNANLSTGGRSVDVMGVISRRHREAAAQAAQSLSLAMAGVDVISPDITSDDAEFQVLEVNSSPGLSNFAADSADGAAQTRALYRSLIMKAMNG